MLLTSSIGDSQRLVIIAIIAFIGFTGFFTRRSGSSLLGYSHWEKRAFVAFLEGFDDGKNDTTDEDDVYYVATRVLVYQLLHGPETRTLTSIPVVVMCTKDVAEHKRARLEKDGAIVTVVEDVEPAAWINETAQGQAVFTKLRMFEMTQYNKLLGLDADMLITRRLDGVFDDPGTQMRQVAQMGDRELPRLEPGEPVPPAGLEYMMAGQPQQSGHNKPYPPDPDNNWLCLGFFLFKPSQAMFDYYMALKGVEGRFDPIFPDQNMLAYAHREDGPMPWIRVDYRWTSTFPTFSDYLMGAASLHEKYWKPYTGLGDEERAIGNDKLHAMWWKVRWSMDAFYEERERTSF